MCWGSPAIDTLNRQNTLLGLCCRLQIRFDKNHTILAITIKRTCYCSSHSNDVTLDYSVFNLVHAFVYLGPNKEKIITWLLKIDLNHPQIKALPLLRGDMAFILEMHGINTSKGGEGYDIPSPASYFKLFRVLILVGHSTSAFALYFIQ